METNRQRGIHWQVQGNFPNTELASITIPKPLWKSGFGVYRPTMPSYFYSCNLNILCAYYRIKLYRTQDGAEIDFVLEKCGHIVLAIEAKLSNIPEITRGTTIALQDPGNPPLLIVTP